MTRRPRILITTYPADAKNFVRLPREYIDATRRAGAVALLLAPGDTGRDVLDGVDGVIVAGGGDLSPQRSLAPGAATSEHIYDVDDERDASEIVLVGDVLKRRLPLLCICRGFQVLNVALGGTLLQHLPDVPETIAHRADPPGPLLHPVQVDRESRLARTLQATKPTTASWHHQAIDRLGDGLRVAARAPDGVIEAVELEDEPQVTAVQWHPELTAAEDPSQQRLFDALVGEAVTKERRAVESLA